MINNLKKLLNINAYFVMHLIIIVGGFSFFMLLLSLYKIYKVFL